MWRKALLLLAWLFVAVNAEQQAKDYSQHLEIALKEQEKKELAPREEERCPSNCSNHGECRGNTCSCDANYHGSDCSYYDQPLQSGVPLTLQTVRVFKWNYYHIQLSGTGSLDVWVNETTGPSDCDVYLQRNQYPTHFSYYASDTSLHEQTHLSVPQATFGTWFIGVYGFSTCYYNIVAYVGTCPANCNGNGQCHNGVCTCNAGYFGNDCSLYEATLQSGAKVSSSVGRFQWTYFAIPVTSHFNLMTVAVSESGSHPGDVDIYIKKDARPSLSSWDYMNATVAKGSTVTIYEPVAATYHIGVFGFTASNFDIQVDLVNVVSVCPGNCSYHGDCISGTCQCYSGFSGSKCETMDSPLPLGTPVAGYVASGLWNYYNYHADSSNSLMLAVVQASANGDCDLYVRSGQVPTRFRYDYTEMSTRQAYNLTIPPATNTTWNVGIFGFRACGYNITAFEFASCSCSSSKRGYCATHSTMCNCFPGYCGNDCSQACSALTSGVPVNNSVSWGTWQYYTFTPDVPTSSIEVAVQEDGSAGFVGLYVNTGTAPTLVDFSSSNTSASSLHTVHLIPEATRNITYYVGVVGSSLLPRDQRASFKLAVFATQF